MIKTLSQSQGILSTENQKACKERGANTQGRRLKSNAGGVEGRPCALLLLLLSSLLNLTPKIGQSGRAKHQRVRTCVARTLGLSSVGLNVPWRARLTSISHAKSPAERPSAAEMRGAGEQQGPESAAAVQRCGVKKCRLRWPSGPGGADPASSSGAPPARILVCKPVRGDDTGVGVVVRGNTLSASSPPVAFADSVPP
eukprot:6204312-Pleurochrysis_carterae.AAC.3